MELLHLARQQTQGGQSAGGSGGNSTKPKDPMLQPAGPGLPPWIVWLPKLHSRHGMHILWWIFSGIVGTLTLLHVVRLVRAYAIRKRVASLRKTGGTGKSSGSSLHAARAAWSNFCHVRVPVYLFPSHTVSDWFWTAAYVGLVIGMTFWAATYKGKMNYTRVFGLASIAQLPLIVGLAGRNNIVSLLTGISYEKLNWLHRAAGRTCVLTAWAHMGAMVGQVGVDPNKYVTQTGILGLTAITLMFLSSFGLFRRLAYEAFIVLHICMGITLLVAIYHHRPMYRVWLWSSMLIWGLDRFVSLLKLAYVNIGRLGKTNATASVSLLAPDVVRVVVKVPNLKWKAGQHAFLVMPTVARLRYEAHPFTMANIPSPSGEAVFIARAHSGFTRRLVDSLTSSSGQVKCYVDGPYGIAPSLDHYAGVLLIAGGTGITYTLSHLLGIIQAAKEGSSAVSSVRLVWNTRDHGDSPTTWISSLVSEALSEGTGNLRVEINVHVTGAGGDTRQQRDSTPSEESPTKAEHGMPSSIDQEKAMGSETSHSDTKVLSVRHGRAEVESILRSQVATVPADAGGMAVVVCGPTSLSIDTRRAVCRVNTTRAVSKGQVPIEFYAERFGW